MAASKSRRMRAAAAAVLAEVLAAALMPAAAEPFDYATEPTHTFVNFEVLHGGLSTRRGRFDRSEGRVTLDRAARSGSIEFTVRTGTVDTGDAVLDTRLRQALDSDTHPLAQFVAHELAFDGDKLRKARGTLDWRGTSLPLEIAVDHFNCYLSPLFRREVCGGEFSAEIEPARWGVALDPALAWAPTLKLRVQIEAVRQ